MKIDKQFSYAITVCNEYEELDHLLNILMIYADFSDSEIVLLIDENNTNSEVKKVILKYKKYLPINYFYKSLNKDFGEYKNYLNSKCKGRYIFNIDADETPSYYLLNQLEAIVLENNVEGLYLPRVNVVDGITMEHINKWGWHVNEKGHINWPDYQLRIYLNNDRIKWHGKVHETLSGFGENKLKKLPMDEKYALMHHKQINKQEQQNSFYETI